MQDALTSAAGEESWDPTALQKLGDDLGAETALLIVQGYLEALPGRIEELRSADADVRRRAAHTIKSGAALVGLTHTSQVSLEVEKEGRDPEDLVTESLESAAILRTWMATQL